MRNKTILIASSSWMLIFYSMGNIYHSLFLGILPNSSALRSLMEERARTHQNKIGNEDIKEPKQEYQYHWAPAIQAAIEKDKVRNPLCHGKEPILATIYASQKDTCKHNGSHGENETPRICKPHTLCRELPHWTRDVGKLYGTEPVIIGLETCFEYRSMISAVNSKLVSDGATKLHVDPLIRIAGLYNSGTNALSQTIASNLILPSEPLFPNSLNVPWGKHVPLRYKWNNTFHSRHKNIRREHVLPIVIVRDPYRWMSSMCKESYDVKWERNKSVCPNLLHPETNQPIEAKLPRVRQVKAKGISYEYKSIADMWSSWNSEYVDSTRPRLIIRAEDMVFHAEQVVSAIATCVGLPQRDVFSYVVRSAKAHGNSSDFLGALIQAGTDQGRYSNLQRADFEYSKRAFNQTLMDLFHYSYGPGPPNMTI